MATFARCVELETAKPSQATIRLQLGGTFYRLYNRSAWLFHTKIRQYKVLRKFDKGLNANIFYTGFPVDKFDEVCGKFLHVKTEVGYRLCGDRPQQSPVQCDNLTQRTRRTRRFLN